jgi:hypothetical protein
LTPFNSISQRPGVIGRSDSDGSDIALSIESLTGKDSPIDFSIGRSRFNEDIRMPGGYLSTSSDHSPDPLKIPLPDSRSISQSISVISENSPRILSAVNPSNIDFPGSVLSDNTVPSIQEVEINIEITEPFSETPIDLRSPTEPLRVIPNFGIGGISKLPLPDSGPATELSTPLSTSSIGEPMEFSKGRYASLSLNVQEPFSDTPVLTPESSQFDTNIK